MRNKFKTKGQATIEAIIMMPIISVLIFMVFVNGIKVYSLLTAENANYSEGIALIRRPSQLGSASDSSLADTKTATFAVKQNYKNATLDNAAGRVTVSTLGTTTNEFAQGWGGRTIVTQVNPNNEFWSEFGGDNSILRAVLTYPASPFISLEPK